jgi:Cu2+-exporting ATPase/Cu+-exporting ATPase
MNHSKTYRVKGMHCASCSAIIEKTFKKTEGVHHAEVNYGTETAKVSFDETKTNAQELSKKIEPLGYSLILPKSDHAGMSAAEMGMSEEEHAAHLGIKQSKEEKLKEVAEMRTKVLISIPLAIFSIVVMGWDILAQVGTVSSMPYVWEEFFHHILPLMATYMLFVVGIHCLDGKYLSRFFSKQCDEFHDTL